MLWMRTKDLTLEEKKGKMFLGYSSIYGHEIVFYNADFNAWTDGYLCPLPEPEYVVLITNPIDQENRTCMVCGGPVEFNKCISICKKCHDEMCNRKLDLD